MKAILSLELRGDNTRQLFRLWNSISDANLGKDAGAAILGMPPPAAWVAEIIGLDKKYKYERRFLQFNKDYSQANSVGSRGVQAVYMLEDGKIYDVKAWKERYFCTIRDWEICRISEYEVNEWLKEKH
jgi:hypothetical protein